MAKRHRGQALIQSIGILLLMLMAGAFVIDAGFYFAVHRAMQNAADAAALAGAAEFFKHPSPTLYVKQMAARESAKALAAENMNFRLNNADIDFGYVDPITGRYNPSNFGQRSTDQAFATTGGYNAVRVTIHAGDRQANPKVPTIFAKVLGIHGVGAQAQAVAIFGGGVQQTEGMRPVYLCQAAWDVAERQYGAATAPLITFRGKTITVGNTQIDAEESCGGLEPGNWGLTDFENHGGDVDVNTVREWLAHGYGNPVVVGNTYEAMPSSQAQRFQSEMTKLQNDGLVIAIPLYSQAQSQKGAPPTYRVSQIASFRITQFKANGEDPFLQGYFVKTLCHSNCSFNGKLAKGGISRLRLVR